LKKQKCSDLHFVVGRATDAAAARRIDRRDGVVDDDDMSIGFSCCIGPLPSSSASSSSLPPPSLLPGCLLRVSGDDIGCCGADNCANTELAGTPPCSCEDTRGAEFRKPPLLRLLLLLLLLRREVKSRKLLDWLEPMAVSLQPFFSLSFVSESDAM
jgi:hypothetical protein